MDSPNPPRWQLLTKPVIIAIAVAIGLAWMPSIEFLMIGSLAYLAICLVELLLPSAGPMRWRWALAAGTFLSTLTVCAYLPVKPLDQKTGPGNYANLRLSDLEERLRKEHRITVYAMPKLENTTVSLYFPSGTRKRDVMKQLGAALNRRVTLEYEFCGTCAMSRSLLWGKTNMCYITDRLLTGSATHSPPKP